VIESAKPGAAQNAFFSKLIIAYISLSVALNVILTLLSAGRLLSHQWTLSRAGMRDSGIYTKISTVLAESAALYTVIGLIYVSLFAQKLEIQDPFSNLWFMAAV
jgi:hypothetical protein